MAGESVIHKRDILGKWGGSVPSIRPLSPEQSLGSCDSNTHLPHLGWFTSNCARQPKAPRQWEYGSGPRPHLERYLGNKGDSLSCLQAWNGYLQQKGDFLPQAEAVFLPQEVRPNL